MIEKLYQLYQSSSGVSTDTRRIAKDNLFFALKGENFDANKFTQQAIEKGASTVVIDNPEYEVKGKTFLVEDSLKALQDLARFHREHLAIPVIGLTGSNGKTTTKELVNAVLSQKYKTFATQGNLNNHIGVPLSILSITNDIEIAVIEMGANHLGEIAFLSSISKPSHGFITNIGRAHIGEFGGFDNIVRGKSELYHYLIKSEGTIFVNSNQEILMNMSKRIKEPFLYPNDGDFYHCDFLQADPYVTFRAENGEIVQSNIIGRYNFDNIATALCIGKYFNVEDSKANKAVAQYIPSNNRSQILEKGNVKIIMDAYNANPNSMEVALKSLYETAAKQKAVILGDMMELGPETETEHRSIGKQLKEYAFDQVMLIGKYMKFAFEEYPQAQYFVEKSELEKHVKSHNFDDFQILIKGSRSMGLETIADNI